MISRKRSLQTNEIAALPVSGRCFSRSCQTVWFDFPRQGFATAIVEGLKSRGVALAVQSILPLRTEDYPTKAKRPHNSRFDLTRLQDVFGLTTLSWREALEPELDLLAPEMR